ncbi:unnamed protein product, partial [Larinioides sclopetarius]
NLRVVGPYRFRKNRRSNVPRPIDDIRAYNAPRISRALFKKLTEHYLDPDEDTEDLNDEEIRNLHIMFRTAETCKTL